MVREEKLSCVYVAAINKLYLFVYLTEKGGFMENSSNRDYFCLKECLSREYL